MSMNAEFLRKVKTGDSVYIFYEPNREIRGVVKELTTDSVEIVTEDRSPVIGLSRIIEFEILKKITHPPKCKEEQQEEMETSEDQKPEPQDHELKLEPKSESKQSNTPTVTPRLPGQAQELLDWLESESPMQQDDIVNWDVVKENLADPYFPKGLRDTVRNLCAEYDNALKQATQNPSLLENRLQSCLSKLLRLAKQEPEAEEDMMRLLGSMYYQVGKYAEAERYYAKGADYLGASYAALNQGHKEVLDEYLDSYVSTPGCVDPFLYKLYSDSAAKRTNVMALKKRIQSFDQSKELDEYDIEELKGLCACAVRIGYLAKLSVQWAATYEDIYALHCLEHFLYDLPIDWITNEQQAKRRKAETTGPKRRISNIQAFVRKGLFGFIYDSPDNRYFYIDQVNKDDCLRELLAYEGMADNLEVSYCLGMPYIQGKEYAAYDVRLTDRGARDAERRLLTLKSQKVACEMSAESTEDLMLRPYTLLEPAPETPIKAVKPMPTAVPVVKSVVPTLVKELAPVRTLPPLEPLPGMGENRFINMSALTGNYYDAAVTSQKNGNLKKAEELYIKALRANEQSASCISNLVTIYLQQRNRLNDAIQLIEAFKDRLTPEKRAAHEIRIYQQGKQRPYRIKMCYLIDEALSQSIKIETKLHYLSMQAESLRVLGEYEMALSSYRRMRQIYDSEVQYRGNNAVTQFAAIRNVITRGEALCYYNLGNKPKSEALAKELLRISSKDETAKGILEGNLNQENQEEFVLQTDEELDVEHSEISNFASIRLKTAPLQTYLRKENVENGQYIGDYKAAQKDIEYIFTTSVKGRGPSLRNEGLRCMAKIVRTILDRYGNDPQLEMTLRNRELTESMAKTYLARSMASYGDAILDEQKEQDTARFVYLQAIATLPKGEVDWTKSLLHYIHSYFHPRQDMAQFVRKNMTTRNPALDLDPLRTGHPQDSAGFLVGMAQLYKTLEGSRKDERFQIVEEMRKNPTISEIIAILEADHLPAEFGTIDESIQTLNQVAGQIQTLYNEIADALLLVSSHMFSRVQCEGICSKLNGLLQSRFLVDTDRRRLAKISSTLTEFQSYFNGREFNSRVSILNTAIRQIGYLADEIVASPTQFSYDVIRSALERVRSELITRLERHHADLPPALELRLMPGANAYVNRGKINVELVISNGNPENKGDERQLADNLEITAVSLTDGVQFFSYNLDESRCVYGGESVGVVLEFRLTDLSVMALGTFDIRVTCGYRYNVRPAEPTDAQVTEDIIIVFDKKLRSEIPNPYRNRIGKEMEDDSMFYGRDELIKELIKSMRLENGKFNYGHGIILYGQTRSGKSSIRHIFRQRARINEPNAVLIDIGNIDDIKEDSPSLHMQPFYQKIVDALDQELRTNHRELWEMQLVEEIESPRNRMLDRPEQAGALCRRYLTQLKNLVQRKQKMMVLIIDEFSAIHDAIKAGSLEESFMQTWKSMIENTGIFTVCFGQDDTPEFAMANQNAFGRMVQKKVTYLTEHYAKQLMTVPIKNIRDDGTEKPRYTDEALDELYRLTAGSTYLTVKTCSLLVDYLNDQGAEVVTPGILRNFLTQRVFKGNEILDEKDFEPQIGDRTNKSLMEVNRQLLLDIARRSQVNGWADVKSLPTVYRDVYQYKERTHRTNTLLLRLDDRDVIDLEEGCRCRIKVGLLTRLLLYKYGKE